MEINSWILNPVPLIWDTSTLIPWPNARSKLNSISYTYTHTYIYFLSPSTRERVDFLKKIWFWCAFFPHSLAYGKLPDNLPFSGVVGEGSVAFLCNIGLMWWLAFSAWKMRTKKAQMSSPLMPSPALHDTDYLCFLFPLQLAPVSSVILIPLDHA